MSEAAAEAGTDTEPTEPITDANGSGTDAEDADAAGLLGGMLGNDPEALEAELTKWKELSRKHEARAAKNAEAARRLQEIEDANKTELQKAVEAQQSAERERDEAITTHSRVMAAAANDLPVELIDHLGSGTAEEINEIAELFKHVIETRAGQLAQQLLAGGRNGLPAGTGARPVESMRMGSAPSNGGTPGTAEDWFRQLLASKDQ